MTDRELLEKAAAAAAGISSDGLGTCFDMDRGQPWNPLTDDGDALRLAVKLHLALLFPMRGDSYPEVGAGQVGATAAAKTEPHDPDPYAATRRAIVRAAAAIADSTDAKE